MGITIYYEIYPELTISNTMSTPGIMEVFISKAVSVFTQALANSMIHLHFKAWMSNCQTIMFINSLIKVLVLIFFIFPAALY